MRFGRENDAKAKKKSLGKLRKAQLITTFGTGAISEMPEYTVILGATDYWDKRSPRIKYLSLWCFTTFLIKTLYTTNATTRV